MPSFEHVSPVSVPVSTTWEFIRRMPNWADLMPGYQGIEILNERDSEWRVKMDVGIFTKLVTLTVHIKRWVDQSEIAFDMGCLEEPIAGEGRLTARALDPATTELAFHMDMKYGGMLGPVVNVLLDTELPKLGRAFAEGICRRAADQGATTN